jgi:hypothetical protein
MHSIKWEIIIWSTFYPLYGRTDVCDNKLEYLYSNVKNRLHSNLFISNELWSRMCLVMKTHCDLHSKEYLWNWSISITSKIGWHIYSCRYKMCVHLLNTIFCMLTPRIPSPDQARFFHEQLNAVYFHFRNRYCFDYNHVFHKHILQCNTGMGILLLLKLVDIYTVVGIKCVCIC